MAPDFRDNWSAECNVWDKVPIHDVNVEPQSAIIDHIGAGSSQIREVGGEDGGRNQGVGHGPD